jgi:hypothetical protein
MVFPAMPACNSQLPEKSITCWAVPSPRRRSTAHARGRATGCRGNSESLWNWCLEQDRDGLLDLLAYGLEQTVNAVQLKTDDPEVERFVHADALEKALGADMTSWFRPTAENYSGPVSKAGIIEALKEARGIVASRLGEGEEIRPRRHRRTRGRRHGMAARAAAAGGLAVFARWPDTSNQSECARPQRHPGRRDLRQTA